MKTKPKTNSMALCIWVAEHGDSKARAIIKKEACVCEATISKILNGHMPRPGIRYRIYKLTGVKLCGDDDFPERQEAS